MGAGLRGAPHGAACAPSAHRDTAVNRIAATMMLRMDASRTNCVPQIFASATVAKGVKCNRAVGLYQRGARALLLGGDGHQERERIRSRFIEGYVTGDRRQIVRHR